MSSIAEQLNQYMPSLLNKNDLVYKAIFGDITAVKKNLIETSADYKSGAIVNELEYAAGFCEYITRSGSIDNYYGEFLDRVVWFFLGLKRSPLESDTSLRNRFKAFVQRNGNINWITKWAILDVFSYYFDKSILFIVENYITNSKIGDPDFELNDSSWTTASSGTSSITRVNSSDAFSGGFSMRFIIDALASTASLSQSILVDAGEYRFSFWIKDDIQCSAIDIARVKITRSGDGYYYNFDTNTWQATAVYKYIPKTIDGLYRIQQMFIKTSDTRTLTITIQNSAEVSDVYTFWVDLVEFGSAYTYPNMKLIIISIGGSINSMALFPGEVDPDGGLDYTLASYIGQSSLSGYSSVGVVDYYLKILNMIRPAGVYGTVEIVYRDL